MIVGPVAQRPGPGVRIWQRPRRKRCSRLEVNSVRASPGFRRCAGAYGPGSITSTCCGRPSRADRSRAPKIRAMEIITELDRWRAVRIAGCLGFLGFDGSLDTNLLIRTLVLGGGWASFSWSAAASWRIRSRSANTKRHGTSAGCCRRWRDSRLRLSETPDSVKSR